MSILIILAAAFAGSFASFLVSKRFDWKPYKGTALVVALVVVAGIAAVGTNTALTLLDLGLPFTVVDVIEAVCYFVFGFTATAASILLEPSKLRWLLLALVPLAFIEPLRLAMSLLGWWVRKLAA